MNRIRGVVFWPTFILVGITVAVAFFFPLPMMRFTNELKDALLDRTQPLFSLLGPGLLILLAITYISPLGATRIGGSDAKPIFPFWSWFSIALGTTTAVGILFWGCAEPLFHVTSPPASLGIVPNSPAAGRFALATLFMHWTLVPHAIYTLPALLFALAFYNDKRPFSIASSLYPIHIPGLSSLTDSLSLYCLVVGMAATLATGVLSVSGGIQHLAGVKSGPAVWGIVGFLMVSSFALSSASGLERGVKKLSAFNTCLFFFLIFYFLFLGPTSYLFSESFAAMREFFATFWERSTFTAFQSTDKWPRTWPVFYFANWLAWAPVTGVFLGRISYGYTVRTFIVMFLAVLASFGAIWICVFGGVAIHMHVVQHLPLAAVLSGKGAEGVMFFVLSQFPLAKYIIPIFLLGLFISCVMATDSNTIAMAALSTKGIDQENPNPPFLSRLVWGIMIGALAEAMLFAQGLEGIRTISTLGGFPALFFEFGCAGALAFRVFKSIKEARQIRNEVPVPVPL